MIMNSTWRLFSEGISLAMHDCVGRDGEQEKYGTAQNRISVEIKTL
jgi:hypothetical protein